MSVPSLDPLPSVANGQQQTQVAAGTIALLSGRVKEYAGTVFKQRKPWSEVLDRTNFSKPSSLAEATSRIRRNLAYFRVNYLIVVLLTLMAAFIMNPSSLFVLGFLLASWMYVFVIRQSPLVIGGRQLSEREKFLAMAAISFVTIFFLTNVGSVVFTALTFSVCVVALHGATRVPDDLFIDDAESQSGLLSGVFGPPAPSAVVSSV